MSLVCGFNMFNQLNVSDSNNIQLDYSDTSVVKTFTYLNDVEILDFSWSGVLFLQDGELKYRGHMDEKDGQLVCLKVPNKEEISQGRCKDGGVIILTKCGRCWQFSLTSQVCSRLALRESNSEEGLDQVVTDLSTSDNITLLLNNMGEVYSYPSLISTASIKVIQVVCGLEHCAILTERGLVCTWGSSSRGQLGHGDIEGRDEPEELVNLSGLGVVSLAAGGWHTCALTPSGDVYSWGWNHHKQLGLSSSEKSEVVSEPKLVELPSEEMNVKSVSCGTHHSVFLLDDSSVYGCGSNKWCQMGCSGEPSVLSNLSLIYKPPSGVAIRRLVASHWNTALITQSTQIKPDD